MVLEEQVGQQRVKYVVSSYQLEGDEAEAFAAHLNNLLQEYAAPLVELALAETIVANWARVPIPRGTQFLEQVHTLLMQWQAEEIASTLTPQQFQQVTGLDPSPVFGSSGLTQSIVQPR